MAYDPKKAALFNQLRQQGVSEEAAIVQAGITDAEIDNYAIGTNGQLGALIVGFPASAGRNAPGQIQSVNYDETSTAYTSSKTTTSYTSTSTVEVSGGGSTTITDGPALPTNASRALQPALDAKQAEIDAFIKDNPSNFARKKLGLPPLTPEEFAARNAQLNALQDQQAQIYNQQLSLLESTPGSTTTVPNTTTTTQTVITQTSSTRAPVNFDQDESLGQQNEEYLATTTGPANTTSSRGTPVNRASDPSQFPAYDDEGNLQPGFAVNEETGQTYYRGFPSQDARNQPVSVDGLYDYGSEFSNTAPSYADAEIPLAVDNPYYGLTGQQIQQLGGADPTDPYIRARLGLPQLPGSTLLATPALGTIKTGIPLVDTALNVLGSLFSFGGKATTPSVTKTGTTTGSPVPTPDTAATAQDAAKLRVQDSALTDDEDQNLQNIVGAQTEINQAEENIQSNNRSILANEEAQAAAQEQQRQAQAIIDQNNAELADDNLSDARRAELEANNAAQYASIAQNAAVIDEAQTNIDNATANNARQTESIQTNQGIVAENSAAFTINSKGVGAGPTQVSALEDPATENVFDPGATYNGPAAQESVFDPQQDVGENVFDPGQTFNANGESVFNPDAVDPATAIGENVFDPGQTFNANGESVFNPDALDPAQDIGENVFDPGQTFNANGESVFNPDALDPATDVGENVFDPGQTVNANEESVFDPTNVDPNSDPFEQARFDAAERLAEEPVVELTPEELDAANDPFEQARLDAEQELNRQELAEQATDVEPGEDTGLALPPGAEPDDPPTPEPYDLNPEDDPSLPQSDGTEGGIQQQINDQAAAQQAASELKAKNQATLQARYKQPASTDWRVRLQLAPNADYLYKDRSGSTILAPLYETDGVIFPYTPQIETSYNANYEMYDLTHSNFRGYFYKNSRVNDINIRATFTAQDTQEANYLLAVIHFFRSVTKMFYGAKDALRGAPPPLVYLSGLGQYQFNQHPCVVSQFNYSLPNDVDYIRAGAPNNYGTNLLTQRARTGAIAPEAGNPSLARLLGTLTKPPVGATTTPPSPSMINQNVNNLAQATYVPTKIEISLTLLPINTRSQVSTQFNMKDFASGALIKGGFW